MDSRSSRSALIALIAIAALAAACSAVGALLGNEVTFNQRQLQQALDRSFPKHYDQLGGLVSLTMLNPRLTLPQDSNRLRLDFDLGVGALGSDSSRPSGQFSLTSALRYDPNTRGLHLDQPALEHVDVPALGGVMNSTIRGVLNGWLGDYAREEPVYQFDNSLLGRLGARRVERTDIEHGRVVVHLAD